MSKETLAQLLERIARCTHCAEQLPLGPNPVVVAHQQSKIALVSQAPSLTVHQGGIAWADKSGDRLRDWLGVDEQTFYQPEHFAILPMAFCYPGRGKSGDLPPPKACAPMWHEQIWARLEAIELVVLIGKYAQDYYLGKTAQRKLTETVRHFEDYLEQQPLPFAPIPHPSPRNNIWMAKNAWFERDVVPQLREQVAKVLMA